MAQLLKESYDMKVNTEQDAMDLVNKERNDTEKGGVVDYRVVYKTKKSKGEIIDDWYIVTITRKYEV